MTSLSFAPTEPERARVFGAECGVSSTLAQLLLLRGIERVEDAKTFLSPRLSDLSSPASMLGREEAADRLAHAIRKRERIAVFGDYDVDGTTSAAILSEVLQACGADVHTFIAQRFDGGYGFSSQALERICEVQPRVIVTCDCGSSDHARIAEARARGIDVIVVDHHLVPTEALPAFAFLNPHQDGCGFAYKHMTSAGLAFSLGAAVRQKLDVALDMRKLLDLVALGTIADVAPMDGDNRRLVRAGLLQLGADDVRPGIAALRDIAKVKRGTAITAQDVAFRFAPRLNAAGRIADPALSLALLRAKSADDARGLAAQLDLLNQSRRTLEQRISEEALAQVEQVYGASPKSGIVVAGEGWHRGVVGITAARLVDKFHVPVIAVAIDDGVGHGSCRAPEGYRLYDAVSACRDGLEAFGGHQAAAGLTVRQEKIDALRAAFSDSTRDCGADEGASKPLHVDIAIDDATFPMLSPRELGFVEPTGMRNPEPRFAFMNARVERSFVVAGSHLRMELRHGAGIVSAFGFDLATKQPPRGARINVAGSLRIDSYRGNEQVEMRIDALQTT